MRRQTAAIWLVESISLSRLLAALLFASLAFQDVPILLVSGLYVFAMCTDLIDGYLARKLKADTYFGKVVDLVSDKSMTIVSLLYAASRGISVFPLSLIAIREIIMIGARIIVVEDRQLFPTSRILGGLLAFLIWGNTLFLVLTTDVNLVRIARDIYWACAIVFTLNLLARIYKSAHRIKASVIQDQ
ncbi:MAG: CDP-diacylglycerol---glycerol-3-phosphate 3-phosphatidyltransferase [Acidobacteriota bacterium]|jgi:phosphatidylglycerophosphate synthase|nr:CDP-diacylglycerol---glycerol-3-phosphate 3-phosphatidyltransferase [Acidobacteriota bacterium]